MTSGGGGGKGRRVSGVTAGSWFQNRRFRERKVGGGRATYRRTTRFFFFFSIDQGYDGGGVPPIFNTHSLSHSHPQGDSVPRRQKDTFGDCLAIAA